MGDHPHAGDTMSEHPTADPTDLDAREAAETIGRLQSVDDAVARRAAGVTWMIWGLVAPAIFVTYAAFGSALRGTSLAILEAFLWAPWVLLGVLASSTVWETAGAAVPGVEEGSPRRAVVGILVFVVPIFLALGAADVAGLPGGVAEDLVVLAGLGGGSLVAGATGALAPDRGGRRLFLASGAFLLAVAVAGAFGLAQVPARTAYDLGPALATVASSLAFFVPGLLLARGG